MMQDAWGWAHWDGPEGCTGREEGGGSDGEHKSIPVVDLCQCVAKPMYNIVISLPIEINIYFKNTPPPKKKKKKTSLFYTH